MDATELSALGLLDSRHYQAAAYLSICDSLPILRKKATDKEISSVILSKALIAASAKLTDNLIDRWYNLEQTVSCLKRLRSVVLNNQLIDWNPTTSVLDRAESSAIQLFRMGHEIVRTNFGRYSYFGEYVQEVVSLIDMHIELSKIRFNSIDIAHGSRLLNLFLERGVGRMFMAIDLCCLQSVEPNLLPENELSLNHLRIGNDIIWRAFQLNDDIGDLTHDLRHGSANAAVEIAAQRSQLLDRKMAPELRGATQILGSSVCPPLIRVSFLTLLMGANFLKKAEKGLEGKINVRDLIHGYKLLWLFTIRKASTLRARVVLARALLSVILELPIEPKVALETRELLSLILPYSSRPEKFRVVVTGNSR